MEYASKTEAINGADNTKVMTPLRVKQSILANSQGGGGGITEETDPIFMSSPAYNITQNDIDNWNSGGGDIVIDTEANNGVYMWIHNGSIVTLTPGSYQKIVFDNLLTDTSNGKLIHEDGGIRIGDGVKQILVIAKWNTWLTTHNKYINVVKNGTAVESAAFSKGVWTANVVSYVDVVEGDYIEIQAYHDHTANINIASNYQQTGLKVIVLGETIVIKNNSGTGEDIDLSDYALKTELPTKTSELTNDSGFINEIKTINGQSLIGTGDIDIDIDVGECNVVVSPTTPTTGEPVWVQYSYNLFDKSTATSGHLLEDGTSENYSSFKKSAYIPVEPNETYTLQHNDLKLNNTFNCLYDKDKNFVASLVRKPGNNVITIPDGVYYIRVSLYLGNIGSGTDDDEDNIFQMVKGSTALPYMAYNPAKDDRILLKKGDVYDELFAKSKLDYPGGGTLTETDPVFSQSPAFIITQDDIEKWNNNTGCITEETDPVFSQSPAFIITQDDIEKWNSFSGGSNASKLIFVEESDGSYTLRKAGQ